MAETSPPPATPAARRAAARAARELDRHGFLHGEARQRLLEQLQWVALEPAAVLDLGCGTGAALAGLAARFPRARLLALDRARPMLAAARSAGRLAPPVTPLCADAAQLPLATASLGLVWSSLLLAYCPDPRPVLAEARRVLTAPGLFSFCTLGPGTLAEWRAAWQAADGHVHFLPPPDMHDLGDLLVAAGFSEPVLNTEVLTVTYAETGDLVRDLRAAGALNASRRRNPGLTGRAAAARLAAALHGGRGADGRFAITVELVFGQAWAAETRRSAGGPVAEIPLSAVRRPGGNN